MRKGGMMGNGKGPERGGYPQGEHQAVGQHLAADDTGRGDELFCGDVHHDAFRRGVYQGDRLSAVPRGFRRQPDAGGGTLLRGRKRGRLLRGTGVGGQPLFRRRGDHDDHRAAV